MFLKHWCNFIYLHWRPYNEYIKRAVDVIQLIIQKEYKFLKLRSLFFFITSIHFLKIRNRPKDHFPLFFKKNNLLEYTVKINSHRSQVLSKIRQGLTVKSFAHPLVVWAVCDAFETTDFAKNGQGSLWKHRCWMIHNLSPLAKLPKNEYQL